MRPAAMRASGAAPAPMSEELLSNTPSDLVCAITHDLFLDPVINALGQVYERSAIERHLAACGAAPTDPITNSQLPSAQLTPVFPMRSRAAEYRESAARAAVARATAPDCRDPLPYLRRAADLLAPCYAASGGAPSPAAAGAAAAPPAPKVPGISEQYVRFLQQHPGPAYDAMALKYFANELKRGGHIESASAVLYRLLLGAHDTAQQAEFLQLCLECWASTSAPAAPRGAPGRAPQACPAVVARLADFVQDHEGSMTPGQVLDLLEAARLGPDLLLALCQELVGRAAGGGGGGGSVSAALPASLAMRYAQISAGQLGGAVEELRGRVGRLDAQVQRQQQQQQGPAGAAGPHGAVEGKAAPNSARWWHGGARALAAAVLAAATMAGGNHPVLRAARLAPLLFLLNEPGLSVGPPHRWRRAHPRRPRQQQLEAQQAPHSGGAVAQQAGWEGDVLGMGSEGQPSAGEVAKPAAAVVVVA